MARPKAEGTYPGLIIIHENRGLTPHGEDVARRYANQGYVVFAPDLLSRVGGTAKFGASATQAINALNRDDVIADLNASLEYLKGQRSVVADHVGVIGYCWGGGNSLLFATRTQGLRAAVVYYGPNPPNIDDVANITAPVLGIYGERDTRISMNVPGLVEAMKKHGKAFDYTVYPGAAHAFFNDTGGQYHAEAAAQAWVRTNEFLARELKQ
jgi:carboxymethylenebutenolidase